MRLRNLEISGFKSFAQKTTLDFENPIVAIVGPNGSGKSNVVEAIRYVLGEQSMKSMRGRTGSDLIWKGSKNLSKGSRAYVSIYFNNEDKVFKLSNEGGEEINLNFDTVSISREVYPDGVNKYILNGSEVRLKDIHNLLASVNIGSSGHHIISQGESDRILNANIRDLREMVEDALGLKIYQYKIKESERKLERAEENMKEVALLRRENAPHLRFLEKQVEKFEKAKEMKEELLSLYRGYLKRENLYLSSEKRNLSSERAKAEKELEELDRRISRMKEEGGRAGDQKIEELKKIEEGINNIRRRKGEIERKLGRIEGMIEAEEKRREMAPEEIAVPRREIREVVEEVNSFIEQALSEESLAEVKLILSRIREILERFSKRESGRGGEGDIKGLRDTHEDILKEVEALEREERKKTEERDVLKGEIEKEVAQVREEEREKFALKVKRQELSSGLDLLLMREENLKREEEAFENEIKEGSVLVGPEILSYKDYQAQMAPDRQGQEEERKKIERIKIRLEDAGLSGGAEILKEFNEVKERDAFLFKEMEDLGKSVESLNSLMADLKEKIDSEFKQGVKKINVEFQEFFSLMFGGGSAKLSIVLEKKRRRGEEEAEEAEEEEILEEGLEINVSLPHKKVKELHALSGGERSLTSIALLFAMSQVNPPPFLVLDETDAALDEANSRKYGDMLEKLSKASQLVVVTHNRETMSRAGVLYGVTIGGDGASKLLSVRFEEATAIAK